MHVFRTYNFAKA